MKPIRAGFWGASLFLVAFLSINGLLWYSAKTNKADSGEGGILLIPFLSPWFFLFQGDPWMDRHFEIMTWVFIATNTLIVFYTSRAVWYMITLFLPQQGAPPGASSGHR
jgi:hypothetical protein